MLLDNSNMTNNQSYDKYAQVRGIFEEIRAEAEKTGGYFRDILNQMQKRAEVRDNLPVIDAIAAKCLIEKIDFREAFRRILLQ
jgi:hypothetical protein